MRKPQRPIPREHGAWGLLLEPFVAAAMLGRQWDWLLVPALLLALLGFLVREPLIILARCQWAGHAWTAQSRTALQWLAAESAGLAVCFLVLWMHLPLAPLCALAAGAVLFTGISVWFAVTNRQRSVGLQIVAVAGLGSSALLAALASTRMFPSWVWWLWGLLTLHSVVAVLCVHARLRMRIAAGKRRIAHPLRTASYALAVHAAIAIPAVFYGGAALALPVALSVLFNGLELFRLTRDEEIRAPLPRVGFRMLAQSLTHTAVTVAVLWTFPG